MKRINFEMQGFEITDLRGAAAVKFWKVIVTAIQKRFPNSSFSAWAKTVWLRCRTACAIALVLMLQSFSAFASDTFPGTTLTGSGSMSASNAGATAQAGEPGAWAPINSIWYSWTAPSNGILQIQTCGSTVTSFDTTLALYTGTAVNLLTLLQSNDDTGNCSSAVNVGYGSSITQTVVSGTTYRIQVDGFGGATGTYLLQYNFTPTQPIMVVTTDASATEGGDTALFNMRLGSIPTANVTVTLAADPTGQCTFSPTTLTFTTANWNTPQNVTATANNDVIAEGNHSCSPGSITATGGGFTGQSATPPVISILDNDIRAVSVLNTDNTAVEGGTGGEFTVRLLSAPTANVTVAIGADPATPDQCTFSTTALTFTTANWASPQVVSVTAVNDVLAEGQHTCTTGAILANGGGYVNVAGTAPTFDITDNDQGLIVTKTDGTTEEGLSSGTLALSLATMPTATVTVTIAPDPATPDQCTFSPATLTFTTANWNTVQNVTASAVDDAVVDGAHSCSTGTISAAGGDYSGLTSAAQTFTITDNDNGTINVVITDSTASEAGDTGAATVVLGFQPSGTVTVSIAPDPATPDQCTFAPTMLTFTTANWNVAQTVTATAVDDAIVEGTHLCTTGAITAVGGSYDAVVGAAPVFTVTDNDIASISLNKTANVVSVAMPGDAITFAVEITNTGTVNAINISVTDSLTSVTCPSSGTNFIALLAPTSSEICTAVYLATQADFDGNGGGDGDIDNTAAASGTAGGAAVSATDSASVACPRVRALAIDKSASPPTPLVVGQTINYSFTVTNTGNVTITDVSVVENLFNGTGSMAAPAGETLTDNAPFNTPGVQSQDIIPNDGVWSELKPNDVVTFTANYTVQQSDIDLIQ